jgi:AcrR family transcriptional regulator
VVDARGELLERIVDEVAARGLGDRSLRDIASAVGSSHRMLLYHFGSRPGLVAAIVDSVEAAQRDVLRELAAVSSGPRELVVALWRRVSSPELRPFIRLFFESVAASAAVGSGAGDRLTSPWLDDSRQLTELLGVDFDPVEIRLGVAVTRGLLIDVLVSGDAAPATDALLRFVERWLPEGRAPGA